MKDNFMIDRRNKMVGFNKKWMLLGLMMLLVIGGLIAQEAVVNDEAAVMDEEMFTVDSDMGWLEVLARKIVGSGLVDIFIQGGFVMWPMLILVIWAIATVIWKLVILSYARIDINELIEKIKPLVEAKKYKEAAKICEETRGPAAVVLHLALLKADNGVEAVEKAIESAAALELAYLDKGFIALSTTINLAPMFGFFGTVVGMIAAFDAIARAGEVDPTIVASGIKIALITTAAGLAVAIPIQFFNNMFMGMVDNLVIDMQKASESLVEIVVKNHQ